MANKGTRHPGGDFTPKRVSFWWQDQLSGISMQHPRLKSILLLFCLLSLILPTQCLAVGLFHPKTFTLANGLKVIVITNTRAPVVKQVLLYRAGSIDETVGKSGIAHFLEHLMFKGTKKVSGEEFVRTIENLGGSQNAQTSRDFTLYY